MIIDEVYIPQTVYLGEKEQDDKNIMNKVGNKSSYFLLVLNCYSTCSIMEIHNFSYSSVFFLSHGIPKAFHTVVYLTSTQN